MTYFPQKYGAAGGIIEVYIGLKLFRGEYDISYTLATARCFIFIHIADLIAENTVYSIYHIAYARITPKS